ncbi:ATP-binding protein, partial [Candidatus Woesearchaeota archaeon]|nr:ATP-binding protein [Candidatus Woesearchaeota archaeon]
MLNFKTTAELKVSNKIAEQIIGQDQGLQLIKKAAQHRRHVMLIGNPGTGKSLLGQALAELLPTANELQDVLCYPNEKDPNNPIIKT